MPLVTIIGVLLGGVFGIAWYRWMGCASGTCPLLTNPYTSILYGMLLGALIASGIR